MVEERLENWLSKICIEQDVSNDIVAYCFNLYETIDGYGIYLSGASSYDEDCDDWACDPSWQSEYMELNGGDYQGMSWQTFLEIIANAVRVCISSTETLANYFQGKIITVGFEDGNLQRIF